MKYFTLEEFRCPCCGENKTDILFIERLDHAREHTDIPFKILSGYRCEKHNKEVGGVIDSAHTKGLAADIACTNSYQRWKIIDALKLVGFRRIGIAKTFIHVDEDMSKPLDVIWVY